MVKNLKEVLIDCRVSKFLAINPSGEPKKFVGVSLPLLA